jgi:hypothetical protein
VAEELKQLPFQRRVRPWMMACFGPVISNDKQERNHRFLEEALELVQACGATASEARQLVEYVYGRPVGEPVQEVGGVMVTLAALCLAQGLDMHDAAEVELERIWTKVEQIRQKQASKPPMGPLPGAYPEHASPAVNDDLPLMADLNAQMLQELQQSQARIDAALAHLRDDGHAATFHTLGQYRAALIRLLEGVP